MSASEKIDKIQQLLTELIIEFKSLKEQLSVDDRTTKRLPPLEDSAIDIKANMKEIVDSFHK